jgi:prepilin-type N-terminal cleavage/methylation domain-containing protein
MGKSSQHQNRKRQSGMTLVEMSTALVIGLLLAIVLGELLFSNLSITSQQRDSIRLESRLRQAMDFMGRSVRNAGYTGCSRMHYDPLRAHTGPALYARPLNPTELAAGALADAGLLHLGGAEIIDWPQNPGAEPPGKAILLISDCDALVAARLQSTPTGNRLLPLSRRATFAEDAQLLQPFSRDFFLRPDGLWLQDRHSKPRLLAARVSQMHIDYLLDGVFQPDSAIASVQGWSRVRALRLQLALQPAGDDSPLSLSAVYSLRNRLP